MSKIEEVKKILEKAEFDGRGVILDNEDELINLFCQLFDPKTYEPGGAFTANGVDIGVIFSVPEPKPDNPLARVERIKREIEQNWKDVSTFTFGAEWQEFWKREGIG